MDNKATAHTGLRTHNPQANLQGIAPELRLIIYESLWVHKDRKHTIHTDDPERRISHRKPIQYPPTGKTRTALLRVNKQIYNEAVAIMHRNTDLTLWFTAYRDAISRLVHYTSPPVDAKSRITSIRLSADLNQHLHLAVRFEDFPCLEKLQLMVKGRTGGSTRAGAATDIVCKLIEKCSANANLESVVIEMSYSSLFTLLMLQDLSNKSATDLACDQLQKRVQRVIGDMGKSAVVDVLWCWASVY